MALARLLGFGKFANDLRIHCIGGQIDFSRPRYRATIDENLLEKLRVPQRRECTGQVFLPQMHSANLSVFEADEEAEVRLRLHFHYIQYI